MKIKVLILLGIVVSLFSACGDDQIINVNDSSSETVSSSVTKESSSEASSVVSSEDVSSSEEDISSAPEPKNSSAESSSSVIEEPSSEGSVSSAEPVAAFGKIEAEDFVDTLGVQLEDEGTGSTVGWFDPDDWIQFNLDFGDGANTIVFNLASAGTGASFDVRLDSPTGTIIGTMDITGTGGWTSFLDRSLDITETSGVQDIYLVGKAGTDGICNFDYFELFNIVKPEAPEGLVGVPVEPTDNTIKIDWIDNSDDETGFNIYFSKTSTMPNKPDTTIDANATSFTMEGLSSGTQYTIWVTAENNGIVESDATTTYVETTGIAKAGEDFTIVFIPDTQSYFHNAAYLNGFISMTEWVVANKDALNIVFVSHLGDVVENGHQPGEWAGANGAMSKLDGVVPYGIAVGNHDSDLCCPGGYGWGSDYDNFTGIFPESRFSDNEWWGDDYPDGTNWNSYQLFSAGGMDFIIIHIEVWPGAEPVQWADDILTQFPDRRALISTHDYDDNNPLAPVVKKHENVFIVNRGHHGGNSHREFTGDNGNTVHDFLTDHQFFPEGGEGWFRYMTFKPKENTVYHYTYSDTKKSFYNEGTFEYSMD